ncbi:MAG: hypothetical protein ACOX1O_05815 [Eggerthellaceae bacterium]|jgi:hypothetical protein
MREQTIVQPGRWIGFAFIAAALVAVGMICAPETAQAKVVNKTVWNSTSIAQWQSSTRAFSSKTLTTKDYNIVGSKKADTIKLHVGPKGMFSISVNGKRKVRFNANCGPDLTASMKYMKMKNGRTFLYVTCTGDNADGLYAVYEGKKNGKLVKVASPSDIPRACLAGHNYLDTAWVKGNTLKVRYLPMILATGQVHLTYDFKYSKKAGHVVRTANTTKRVAVGYSKPYVKTLHPRGKLKLYTSAKANKKKTTVKAGTSLSITKACLKGGPKGHNVTFKVKTKKGVTGWFKGTQEYSDYYTLFKETYLAG